MNYRYRVRGVAEKAFILRGMYFRGGSAIDAQITESELDFVKKHCQIDELIDSASATVAPKSIPTNSTNRQRGSKNELSKPKCDANKVANKTKV